MSTLDEWTRSVCAELGITEFVDPPETIRLVLDLARDVAHGVARPAAPVTAYLLGVAAGRAAAPAAAEKKLSSAELVARIRALVETWDVDAE